MIRILKPDTTEIIYYDAEDDDFDWQEDVVCFDEEIEEELESYRLSHLW